MEPRLWKECNGISVVETPEAVGKELDAAECEYEGLPSCMAEYCKFSCKYTIRSLKFDND